MNKQTTYIIVAVVIVIIIVAGAAAYLLYNNGGSSGTSPTATPAPTVSPANATSLSFSANITDTTGQTTTYEWQGINVHTAPTVRVDLPGYSYIMNSTAEQSWVSTDNGATWTASNFMTDWPFWGNEWSLYVDALTPGHWDGVSSTYSYTDAQGQGIVLFNIMINPTIPDSTFATS